MFDSLNRLLSKDNLFFIQTSPQDENSKQQDNKTHNKYVDDTHSVSPLSNENTKLLTKLPGDKKTSKVNKRLCGLIALAAVPLCIMGGFFVIAVLISPVYLIIPMLLLFTVTAGVGFYDGLTGLWDNSLKKEQKNLTS